MRRLLGRDLLRNTLANVKASYNSPTGVQDIRNQASGYPDFTTIVLLHEYAHHFMISNSPFALPAWYSEGGAEFFGATRFNEDGGLTLGLPARNAALTSSGAFGNAITPS